jgi:hypothetical protein
LTTSYPLTKNNAVIAATTTTTTTTNKAIKYHDLFLPQPYLISKNKSPNTYII